MCCHTYIALHHDMVAASAVPSQQNKKKTDARELQSELEINRKCKRGGVTPRKNPERCKRINRVPLVDGFLALGLLSSSLLLVFPIYFELRQ